MGSKTQKVIVLGALGAIVLVGVFVVLNNSNSDNHVAQFDQQENGAAQETQQINSPDTTMQNQNQDQETQNNEVQQEESGENTPAQETGAEDRATVKPDSISLQFSGQGFGYPYQGTFKEIQGEVNLVSNKFSKALFRIAADSVDAGNFIVNSQLKGKDFLDVNNYPEILLTISNVEFTQETNANVSGTLTIKGIAHAVEFPITITGSSFTADFTVDVSQYGISHPNVDNQVHMRVSSQWPNPQ